MDMGDKSPDIIGEIVHPLFRLFRRSDGIVQLNTADDAYFTIKESREYLEALKTITDGKPHLILKMPGKHANVDKDTRMLMATEEALRYSIAEAVVIRNMAQRLIGNFYLRFDRPRKPVRLFDTLSEAETWLNQFLR